MSQAKVSAGYAKGYIGLNAYLGGVAENTLRRWVAQGMPHIKVGDVVLFRLAEVDAWLDQYKSGSSGTLDDPPEKLSSLVDEIVKECRK